MQDLAGTVWRVTGARAFDASGREHPSPMGPAPMGIIEFGSERMMGAIGDGRGRAGPGEAPRRYFSYTGPYRFDGAQLITEADAASSPDLLSPQVRRVRFEGERGMVLIPPPREGNITVEVYWERLR
jgi:hypothetical protein